MGIDDNLMQRLSFTDFKMAVSLVAQTEVEGEFALDL